MKVFYNNIFSTSIYLADSNNNNKITITYACNFFLMYIKFLWILFKCAFIMFCISLKQVFILAIFFLIIWSDNAILSLIVTKAISFASIAIRTLSHINTFANFLPDSLKLFVSIVAFFKDFFVIADFLYFFN